MVDPRPFRPALRRRNRRPQGACGRSRASMKSGRPRCGRTVGNRITPWQVDPLLEQHNDEGCAIVDAPRGGSAGDSRPVPPRSARLGRVHGQCLCGECRRHGRTTRVRSPRCWGAMSTGRMRPRRGRRWAASRHSTMSPAGAPSWRRRFASSRSARASIRSRRWGPA